MIFLLPRIFSFLRANIAPSKCKKHPYNRSKEVTFPRNPLLLLCIDNHFFRKNAPEHSTIQKDDYKRNSNERKRFSENPTEKDKKGEHINNSTCTYVTSNVIIRWQYA